MESFHEVTVRGTRPGADCPYPDGFPTLNWSDGLCIIDAKKHAWPLDLIAKRLFYKRILGRRRLRTFQYDDGGFQLQPGGFPLPVPVGARP
jgi:hypothetical protein